MVMKVKKEKIIHICKKCGWRWIPKIPDKKPRACPYCKSYHWDNGKKSSE